VEERWGNRGGRDKGEEGQERERGGGREGFRVRVLDMTRKCIGIGLSMPYNL
jgi:hypothetical protein